MISYPLAIRLCLFGIAALGATLVLGCLRRFPLGFVASLASGAYTAACLQRAFGVPMVVAIAAGSLAGALMLCLPVLLESRSKGDDYAVLSWLSSIAVYELISMSSLTGGQHGLIGLAPLYAGPEGLAKTAWTLMGLLAALVALLSWFRSLQAFDQACLVGLNPRILEESGLSSRGVSLRVHAIAGSLGGLAGALWGPVYQGLHPDQFGLAETVVILLIGLVGGRGEPLGVIPGLFLVYLGPRLIGFEWAVPAIGRLSRALGVRPPDEIAVVNSLQQSWLGLMLILGMRFVRGGLIPALRGRLRPEVGDLPPKDQT